MRWLLAVGIATTSYYVWFLVSQPVVVEKFRFGISYGLSGLDWGLVTFGYGITTIGALLLSSLTFFRTMGLIVLAAAIVAGAFFSMAFASVWCFFAALLSGALFLYVARKGR